MRYKILFLSSWFPNRLEPTNGNFVQRHAEAVSLLHEVEILHVIGDKNQKEEFIFDDKIINGIRTLVIYFRASNLGAFNFIKRMKAYRIGFKKMQKPDLIHANVMQNQMLSAVYFKIRKGIPFVISEHWSGFLKINRSKLSKTKLKAAEIIAKNASKIMPVSDNLKQNLEDLQLNNSYKVVPNVVDTALFVPEPDKQNKTFTFLHISSLIPLKNPDVIVRTAAKLHKEFPNFELKIGGDGDFESLNRLISELNASDFIFTFGEISSKEVAEKMKQADCFVLYSNYENLPCVLLESMSSGTPVIATKVGGVPEIVKENTGIIIEKSEENLYESMKQVLLQERNFDSSENLHAYIDQHFSKRKIAELFSEVYQETLNLRKKN